MVARLVLALTLALGLVGGLLSVFYEHQIFNDARSALECSLCKTSQLTGTVDDCCIDFQTVDLATRDFFLPLLTGLQKSTFFKYFKVDLGKPCPFWEEDGMCTMRDCSVCECDPNEIPKKWLEEDDRLKQTPISKLADSAAHLIGQSHDDQCRRQEKNCEESASMEKELGRIDRSQSDPKADHFTSWEEVAHASNVWTEQEEREDDMVYVNLELNPERFTGFSGASAWRVWKSIYLENCFEGFEGGKSVCREKRVFFRLISGLQSSITTQIANDYRFDNGRFGPNVEFFTRAVGAHADRLTNMYFAYLFMLRALAKAAPVLKSYDFTTGNSREDAETLQRVRSLVDQQSVPSLPRLSNSTAALYNGEGSAAAHALCMGGFDEKGMFEVEGAQSDNALLYARELEEKRELKEQFVGKFHNISRIMDCVGCEKCKMWGKLETLGIGTAIKILLASESCEEVQDLSRNEVIALVNTAAQLAKSVGTVPKWKRLEVQQMATNAVLWGGVPIAALVLLFGLLVQRLKARKNGDAASPNGQAPASKKRD